MSLLAVWQGSEPKQAAGDFAHLNLFRPFCNAISAMVAVNMLKRHMTAVADSPTGLHCAIGGIAGQTVCAVVTHSYEVSYFHVVLLVEQGGRITNKLTQHGCFSVQFNQWELDSLIDAEFLTPRDALVRITHCFIDAILRCS